MNKTIGSIRLDPPDVRGEIVWQSKGDGIGWVVVLTPGGEEYLYGGKLLSCDTACEWIGASYGSSIWDLEWAPELE